MGSPGSVDTVDSVESVVTGLRTTNGTAVLALVLAGSPTTISLMS
jgi:hypothetical protein